MLIPYVILDIGTNPFALTGRRGQRDAHHPSIRAAASAGSNEKTMSLKRSNNEPMLQLSRTHPAVADEAPTRDGYVQFFAESPKSVDHAVSDVFTGPGDDHGRQGQTEADRKPKHAKGVISID